MQSTRYFMAFMCNINNSHQVPVAQIHLPCGLILICVQGRQNKTNLRIKNVIYQVNDERYNSVCGIFFSVFTFRTFQSWAESNLGLLIGVAGGVLLLLIILGLIERRLRFVSTLDYVLNVPSNMYFISSTQIYSLYMPQSHVTDYMYL